MTIQCLVLGAGQEVGKSCVVVTIGTKTIMFDCGMHMGFHDHRRYPDFKKIPKSGNYTDRISCVIVTHFHLDHIGALPYFTEVLGYDGPIYMTYPTKALAPLMLEDYRKVMVDRRGEEEQFSFHQIQQCIKKVTAVDLKQTVQVDSDLKIQAYYAGHVLGAAMFYVKSGNSSVVYTGDYNMTPDKHLGAAKIDRLFPDLLITESTYAISVRDSKHAREREFLKAIHTCVAGGGKVLIPVFALGRAQELCLLLDDYWERMNLQVPIYFSSGLTIQSNVYYKLLISWTNQNIKETYVTRNKFDFKHVANFDRSLINAPGPCVLFATPGMISGGLSLDVFIQWAPSEKNLIALPGYCVAGTVGHKLMSGKATKIKLDKRTEIDVRCQIHVISFSAHTDAKGIMDLVKHVSPRHTVLVHGEKPQMKVLKSRIRNELGICCYDPANNETVEIQPDHPIKVDVTKEFIKRNKQLAQQFHEEEVSDMDLSLQGINKIDECIVNDSFPVEGIVILDNSQGAKVSLSEALDEVNKYRSDVTFVCCCPIYIQTELHERGKLVNADADGTSSLTDQPSTKRRCTMVLDIDSRDMDEQADKHKRKMFSAEPGAEITENAQITSQCLQHVVSNLYDNNAEFLFLIYARLVQHFGALIFELEGHCIKGKSIKIYVCLDKQCFYKTHDCPRKGQLAKVLCCSWSKEDTRLAEKVIYVLGIIKLNAKGV